MSSLAIISPTKLASSFIYPRTGVHPEAGNDIRRHAMRLRTRQDPHRCSVQNFKGDINAFLPSIMVVVPAICECIHKDIVAEVNSGSPTTKAILCKYIPVFAQLANSFVLSKESESCYWRPTAYCIEWGCCH